MECGLSNHLIRAQSPLIRLEYGALFIPPSRLILAWPCAGDDITFPFLTEPIPLRRGHYIIWYCMFQE